MTDEKLRTLGLWLAGIGVAIALAGLFLAIRYLYDLPIPAIFDAMLEQAARGRGFAGAVILTGPGIIIGIVGYAMYHHFDEKI